MNAETFCEHFATFADAPNGVEKLRELIRLLAVRGKLVAQDRNDEPAVESVEKIQGEKRKLSETGNLKADKKAWVSSLANPPYDIPASWCWVRLQDVFEISRGGSPRPAGDPRYFGGNIPWITVGEVTKDSSKYLTGTAAGLTEEGSSRSRFVNPDDLLLTNSGATLGVPQINKIRGCMNDGVAVLRQFHQVNLNEFAYLYHTQQTSAFRNVNQGMGQPNLNTPIIAGWFFPFPPLAEQRRIVEKVDQLLGLCDELAARQAAQREKRQRLVGATLDRLVSTRNPAEFPTHAHRLRNHFDQLFDTPTTIPQLRQTILELAVQGRLIPQDPMDEPADSILAQMLTFRKQLVESGKIRKQKLQPEVSDNEAPFTLPSTWRWQRWGNICDWITYGFTRPMSHVDTGPPIVTAKNVQDGFITLEETHFADTEEFAALRPKDRPRKGDLLITKDGTIGRAAFVETDAEFCINQSVAVLWLESCRLYRPFLLLVIRSPFTQRPVWAAAEGAAIKHLSITDFAKMILPVPPLAEQKRIVTKVTELLSLCDALEAKLTQGESASTQLLSAAVHHLLNGVAGHD